MDRAPKLTLAALTLLALAAVGCQPAPKGNDLKIGRNGRGTSSGARGGATTSGSSATTWGQITDSLGDGDFATNLGLLVAPELSGSSDAGLGFVSSAASQATGVIFWGQAAMVADAANSSNATLQGSNAKVHIEIWDSTAAQSGGAVSPFVIHIGADQSGFVSATGTSNGSSASLTFTDGYGTVTLQGTIANGYFSGNVSFTNSATSGGPQNLGQFQVSTCGFFTCQ